MKKAMSLSAAMLVVAGTAAPALAHEEVVQQAASRAVVILTPGASRSWVQQMPTSFLNTTMAQVLPDGMSYIATGAMFANGFAGGAPVGMFGAGLPGTTFNYMHGLSGDSEWGLGVGLGLLPAFNANIGAAYKKQLSRGESNALAVNVAAYVNNIGAGGPTIGALVGLPITFDVGVGHLTIDPRLNAASLGAFSAGTTALEAAIGLETPIADRWTLLVDATPGFQLGGGGVRVPVGVGARFSPAASEHVDVTVGELNPTAFGASPIGLVGVTGYVGW